MRIKIFNHAYKSAIIQGKLYLLTEKFPAAQMTTLLSQKFLSQSFDCAKPFICGFCAIHKQKEPKSYSSVLLDNLTKEKARSCIAREIRQEQNEQESKISILLLREVRRPARQMIRNVFRNLHKRLMLSLAALTLKRKDLGKLANRMETNFSLNPNLI